jgi:hypothetical protein
VQDGATSACRPRVSKQAENVAFSCSIGLARLVKFRYGARTA